MKRIILILTLVLCSTINGWAKDIYYCPMHPFYTSDKPGTCPICYMNLVKKRGDPRAEAALMAREAAAHRNDVAGYTPVRIDNRQMQLMGVRTTVVRKQVLVKTVRTFGYISTHHQLYELQDEYIRAYLDFTLAFRDYRRAEHIRRSWETHRELQLKLHEAEDKLLRLGFGPYQIEELQKISWKTPWVQPPLLFFKEGNVVSYWVVAQIFEQDMGFVEAGQKVQIEIPAYGEKTKGIIRSVGGILDQQTRTVNALIELDGYKGELAGNMLVNVSIAIELNEDLIVPQEAVMDTGLRKIVFVQTRPGVFEPREIQVLALGDNGWAVKSGLKEGQKVVVDGNFLMDSESRLQATLENQSGGDDHD
ncbi:MAG: efflux RND transporter periplasmic adaptor subunit [Candidatus Omnitrophica bacterium]|nr:efflux RND transporter periplasmic adaptor subunit [Candidatus Omnitrophota bacterium]